MLTAGEADEVASLGGESAGWSARPNARSTLQGLGRFPRRGYISRMSSPKPEARRPTGLWKPHPDDSDDVGEAMACCDRGEFLSQDATDAFLRWMEGENDESWRDELE